MAVNPEQLPDVTVNVDNGASDIGSSYTTDDSWHGDDLTGTGTDSVYDNEADTSYDRYDLQDRKTVDVRFEGGGSDSGTLWRHRQTLAGNSTQQLAITTSPSNGTLEAYVNGSSAHTYSIVSWDSGDQEYLVAWATEPNPQTTGASDAYRSELQIFNLDTGDFETTTFTHAQFQSSGSGQFVLGADDNTGTNAYANSVYEYRVSKYFHTSTETYETFVEESSEPTLQGEERLENLVPTIDSGIGDDGEFGGPVYAMAAKAAHSSDLLLASPIVNEIAKGDHAGSGSSAGWSGTDSPSDSQLWEDEDGYYVALPHTFHRPLPRGITHGHVRVHLHLSASSAALGGDGFPNSLPFRVYSLSQPSDLYRPSTSPPQMIRYWVSATDDDGTDDDDSSITGGEWIDLGRLKLARDNIGWTYIAIAWDASGLDAEDLIRWKAIIVDPVQYDDDTEPPQVGL